MSSHDDRIESALNTLGLNRGVASSSEQGIRIGLMGRGIGASLTPVMHEREGRRLGLAYRYNIVDFDRLGLVDADFGAMLSALEACCYRGVNVTFPFKQAVISHLDDLGSSAFAIGAVNTVVFDAGRRSGHNTDCFGFAESFRQGLVAVPVPRVVQIGAGGAGAAVAQALAELGVKELDIADIDLARAAHLAAQVASANSIVARGVAVADLARVVPGASGIVNATPIGMEKMPGTPVDPALLDARQWVADVIYFPRETALIQQAQALGCKVLPGGGMAVFQAVRAFELFSGRVPDSAEMAKTFIAYA